MKTHIVKYYKRTLRSFYLSKYNCKNITMLNGSKYFVPFIFKRSKLKICNLVCGFVFFYLTGKQPKLYYKNALKTKKKRKKYKFIGCFQKFENNLKFLYFFLFFRRLNIYRFLGSYNIKKEYNGCNFYKLTITNCSYILKKPVLKWDYFMFYDIFFTNNLKIIYLFNFLASWDIKKQIEFIRLLFF